MFYLFCTTCETYTALDEAVVPDKHTGHKMSMVARGEHSDDEMARLFVEHLRITRMIHMEREVFTPWQEARLG